MKIAAIFSLAMALGASAAAGTLKYTDDKTGISFSGYSDDKGLRVGMALPETPGKDLIMQIVGPAKEGAGWAGFDFSSSMSGKMLLVAWPNGKEVMLSPRIATGYVTPSVYTATDVKLSPIPKGTFVNETHYSATFLCGGCINKDTFSATDADGVFAYAYSTTAVTTPTDPSSALSYHAAGFSAYGMSLADAKSADYAKWAAMADTTAAPPSAPAPSVPGTNLTAPIRTSNVTYDYIVAGGGPAGIITASKLAESGASVLLVERGHASTASTGGKAVMAWNSSVTQFDVPSMGYYLASSTLDATQYCADTASQAGCLLGGSGMINALMFVKPQDADFDDKWPAGWKSADVKAASDAFFEKNPGTDMSSADGKRYDQGAYDVLSTFFQSNGFSSVEPLKEPNKKVDVFAHPPWLIQDHMRGGPIRSYLPAAQAKKNFNMRLNTNVVRAVRQASWTSGIEVQNEDGSREYINVTPKTGKVILAAGALSTPRILFYSGIGPEEQIKKVPSTVTMTNASRIDLPVGKGVQDHVILTVSMKTKQSLKSLNSTAFTKPSQTDIDLFAQGSGVLTQAGQRLNFWTSVKSPSDGQTRFIQGTCNSPADDEVKLKVYLTHGVTSQADLGLDATGKITELKGNPWLDTKGDVDALQTFFDRLIKMTAKPNSTLSIKMKDGSVAPTNLTGAALLADIKSTQATGSHWVRSARMGLDDGRKANGSAVVDTNTKVYGTDNLFVVDASMHADLPTGNTQAIVMVAAEHAADKILALGGGATNGTTAQPCRKRKLRRGAGHRHRRHARRAHGGVDLSSHMKA
ncbi:hypothetical protein PG997_010971 [Apiospora hydei]|uniref:Glucose-methanol-choline oxidoreductase N-terminal domain-containing protein n=1 Tax=Apiospora hydei TaxID=1337664 RepID=A0ABR1VHP8_9PEZI